ncbi:MAG: hypothetical protein K8R25_08630 [Methanosarcinales archaeon]|nr:hypothetical protein [Methanosarcinales archaeon]
MELPYDTYLKVGAVASEHCESVREYIKNEILNSIREELELKDMKKQLASRYAADEISYESLKDLLGAKEAERLRIYNDTILESFREADIVAKRLKE